jgi:hypothetical protein
MKKITKIDFNNGKKTYIIKINVMKIDAKIKMNKIYLKVGGILNQDKIVI